jgi:hypothetical protein
MVSLYPNGILFSIPTRYFHSLLCPPKQNKLFFKFNRAIWTHNKSFKSGITKDALCIKCEERETIEHLLYGCENYSAIIWHLAGCSLTLAISGYSRDYVPNINLNSLEIAFNKPHLSIPPSSC